MLFAWPSEVPPASDTMPNGNVGDVAEFVLHTPRHVSMRFFILHALHYTPIDAAHESARMFAAFAPNLGIPTSREAAVYRHLLACIVSDVATGHWSTTRPMPSILGHAAGVVTLKRIVFTLPPPVWIRPIIRTVSYERLG